MALFWYRRLLSDCEIGLICLWQVDEVGFMGDDGLGGVRGRRVTAGEIW